MGTRAASQSADGAAGRRSPPALRASPTSSRSEVDASCDSEFASNASSASSLLPAKLLTLPTYSREDRLEVRVNHKSGFSVERTFVVWFHLAVTVSMVAFGACSVATSPVMHYTAGLLVLPACFFVVWAMAQFRRRLLVLRAGTVDEQAQALRDETGPRVAVICMCAVVLLNTANAWRHWLVQGEQDET